MTAAALPMVLALGACGGGDSSSSPSSTSSAKSKASSVTSAAKSSACGGESAESSPMAQAAKKAAKAEGFTVVSFAALTATDEDSTKNVAIRVCGKPSQGDALKKDANKIAYAMKSSFDAKEIRDVRLTNVTTGKQPGAAARLRSEDFQANTYAPDLDEGVALAAWKTADEK